MLSNTWKHAGIGAISGLVLALILRLLGNQDLVVFVAVAFFIVTVAYEMNQYYKYGCKKRYWEFRGLDAVVDIIAGNAGFNLLFWIIVLAGG